MTRPVTLFTGQWADLPLERLAAKAAAWGFDGLELAYKPAAPTLQPAGPVDLTTQMDGEEGEDS